MTDALQQFDTQRKWTYMIKEEVEDQNGSDCYFQGHSSWSNWVASPRMQPMQLSGPTLINYKFD